MKLTKQELGLRIQNTKLQIQKHEPEICVYSGVSMMAGGTVAAAVATAKTKDVLDRLDADKLANQEGIDNQEELEQANKKLSLKAGAKIASLYLPSVALTVGGALTVLKGFNVIKGRYVGVCSALAITQSKFEEYKSKVTSEIGSDKEFEIATKEPVEEPKKIEKKDMNIYQRMFDGSTSDEYRENDSNYNYCFVASVQAYYNEVLQTRGHVFLNEVYDSLGMEPTSEGQVLGWLKDGKGDGFVDFGLENPRCKRFVEGLEAETLLDFNVDGVIFDKID